MVICSVCNSEIFNVPKQRRYCDDCRDLIKEFGLFKAKWIAKTPYPKSQELKDKFRSESKREKLLDKLTSKVTD